MEAKLTFENSSWETITNNVIKGLGPKYYPVGSEKKGMFVYNDTYYAVTFTVLDHNKDGYNTMTVWMRTNPTITCAWGRSLKNYYDETNTLRAKLEDILNYSFSSYRSINMPSVANLHYSNKNALDPNNAFGSGESAGCCIFEPSLKELGYTYSNAFETDGTIGNYFTDFDSESPFNEGSFPYQYFLQNSTNIGNTYWTRTPAKSGSRILTITSTNTLSLATYNSTAAIAPCIVIGENFG